MGRPAAHIPDVHLKEVASQGSVRAEVGTRTVVHLTPISPALKDLRKRYQAIPYFPC